MKGLSRRRLVVPAVIAVFALVATGCIGANFGVTKTVRGDAPADAEFTIEATCTHPELPPEEQPEPLSWTFGSDGGTQTETFAGTEDTVCTITEPHDGGAVLDQIVQCDVEPSDIEPGAVVTDEPISESTCVISDDGSSAEVTFGNDGTPSEECPDFVDPTGGTAQDETCTWLDVTIEVVNYFPNARLTVAKVIDDPSNQGFTSGFAADVKCTQGDRVALDAKILLSKTTTPSETFPLTVLPQEGEEDLVCTVNETNSQGASPSYTCTTNGSDAVCDGNTKVTFDYSQFADDDFEPSPVPAGTVTITNTYAALPPAPVGPDVSPASAQAPRFTG